MYWCIMINMIKKVAFSDKQILWIQQLQSHSPYYVHANTALCWSTLLNFCRYVAMDMAKNMCYSMFFFMDLKGIDYPLKLL